MLDLDNGCFICLVESFDGNILRTILNTYSACSKMVLFSGSDTCLCNLLINNNKNKGYLLITNHVMQTTNSKQTNKKEERERERERELYYYYYYYYYY